MKPSIGRTVVVKGVESNGATEAPGIITRAWSSQDTKSGSVAVNLTVFPDHAPPICLSSVMLFETEEQACAYRGELASLAVAHWPTPV